jgi:hypothetical protein
MSTAVFSPGHVVAARYRIEQLLGQGGMGSVYRALQLCVGRPVALKLLSDEHVGSAALLERFQREAVALARLAHPNTVRLFDFGTSEGGCPYLVMEFLRGTDLARDLERQGPFRYDHALRIARQILCSLAEAHGAGIVHRDVKPANVFLCAGRSWPLVKVLDFGIVGDIVVDPVAPKLTRTGTVVGSVAYMSPEQAQGLAAGPAADLYAVGVVLFEMLTRRTLFDPRVCTAQLIAKVMEPAPRLRDVGPALAVPAELEALVADLVERDAERRPASAREVIERIDALLEQADLPPLVRAVALAEACVERASTLRGPARPAVDAPGQTLAGDVRHIPPTEPMLLPGCVNGGEAPHSVISGEAPHSVDGGEVPHSVAGVTRLPPAPRRRTGSLAAAFMLVGVGAGVSGAFVSQLRSTPAGQTLAAAAAPLSHMLLPGAARSEPARTESIASIALPPSGADAPEGDAEPSAAPTLTASAAPAPAAALLPLLPAPVALEVSPPAPPAVSTPAAPAVKPAAKPAPAAPRRRPPRPATPRPEAVSAPSWPEPAPTPPNPAPAPIPVASASPLPSAPETLILPETLGSAASAATPPAAAASESARWPAPPPERERPPAPPVTLPRAALPPAMLPPSTEPELQEPARERARRGSGYAPRLSSFAAVEEAHQAGEISRRERDERIAALRQRQADARARAVEAYREGRISRRELWLRQLKIDRDFEGEPPQRERSRSRIRLHW